MNEDGIDILVLVGKSKHDEDLFKLYKKRRIPLKALLPLHGKPMLEWVIDAIRGSKTIRRIFIVGMEEEQFPSDDIIFIPHPPESKVTDKLQAFGDWFIENEGEQPEFVAIANGDIPTVNSAAIDYFIENALTMDTDFVQSVVTKELMEKTFPKSGRSFYDFNRTRICAGDLYLFRSSKFAKAKRKLQKIQEKRKNFFLIVFFLSPFKAIKAMKGKLTLKKAEKIFKRALGIRGKSLVVPFAEVAMDVDKPDQYELAVQYLNKKEIIRTSLD
jgi:GTP:adenosylcobinamide-phosphate guanylyltransferase